MSVCYLPCGHPRSMVASPLVPALRTHLWLRSHLTDMTWSLPFWGMLKIIPCQGALDGATLESEVQSPSPVPLPHPSSWGFWLLKCPDDPGKPGKGGGGGQVSSLVSGLAWGLIPNLWSRKMKASTAQGLHHETSLVPLLHTPAS